MLRLQKSIATRLALGYGLLVAISIAIIAAVFYSGTIGVLNRSIDGKIAALSSRLVGAYQDRPQEELTREIDRLLSDGIDSDTEIFLVLSAAGQRVTGNLSSWPDMATPRGQLVTREVVRYDKASSGRLMIQQLRDGRLLVVGRDLREQESIRALVGRALAAGAAISLALVIIGAVIFRYQIQARIGEIRQTTREIEAGDLSQRIPVSGDDEFGRLSADINRMLERIEHLMDGVRHVSNAIAHDLRTPLGRIRGNLEDALRHESVMPTLVNAANAAIQDIDDVILLFDKLLQIAQAESGMLTKSFAAVDLNRITRDIVELYDALAEEKQVVLKALSREPVSALGDSNLLANAVACLIDNAIKYAGAGAIVEAGACAGPGSVSIVVRDNGPGIPSAELPKVTERFYRLDRSRSVPGNGLGLAIVSAIAHLHGGSLSLEDGAPGLVARILLPRGELRTPAT